MQLFAEVESAEISLNICKLCPVFLPLYKPSLKDSDLCICEAHGYFSLYIHPFLVYQHQNSNPDSSCSNTARNVEEIYHLQWPSDHVRGKILQVLQELTFHSILHMALQHVLLAGTTHTVSSWLPSPLKVDSPNLLIKHKMCQIAAFC